MNIYKLMERHGITNGLENDQRRLDAFVKELEEAMDGTIVELEKIQRVCESEDGEFAFNLANAIEDRIYALNQFFNNQ